MRTEIGTLSHDEIEAMVREAVTYVMSSPEEGTLTLSFLWRNWLKRDGAAIMPWARARTVAVAYFMIAVDKTTEGCIGSRDWCWRRSVHDCKRHRSLYRVLSFTRRALRHSEIT